MRAQVEQSDAETNRATLYVRHQRYGAHPAVPPTSPASFVGVYVARLEPHGLVFWGWRWTTNPEVLEAVAIKEALDELLVLEDTPAPRIVLPSTGVKAYFDDFIFAWEAKGGQNTAGKKPAEYELWKDVVLKHRVAEATINSPNTPFEHQKLVALEKMLNEVRPRAVRALIDSPDASPNGWHGNPSDFDAWCAATPE